MHYSDEVNFDTDLDDDEAELIERKKLPRLTFYEKLIAHRSNRLTETFGQINVPGRFQSIKEIREKNDILLPLHSKNTSKKERLRIFQTSCHMLDITMDWQLRYALGFDRITIVNRSFSFNDMRAFSTAIEANLESLTLNAVGLKDRSLIVLCQGLRKCPRLNLLDLSYNKLNQHSFILLVETVNDLPSLAYVSLVSCGIQDWYGPSISDLCENSKLTDLNLSGNELEEMACRLISHSLRGNTTLTSLNLSWNRIQSYASVQLFRGFEVNITVSEFDISWSNLGYAGSVALRRILAVNQSLRGLNINSCNIDWLGAQLISEGLGQNRTLQRLYLGFNPLTTHGVHYIVQALNYRRNAIIMLDISV